MYVHYSSHDLLLNEQQALAFNTAAEESRRHQFYRRVFFIDELNKISAKVKQKTY